MENHKDASSRQSLLTLTVVQTCILTIKRVYDGKSHFNELNLSVFCEQAEQAEYLTDLFLRWDREALVGLLFPVLFGPTMNWYMRSMPQDVVGRLQSIGCASQQPDVQENFNLWMQFVRRE